MQLTEILSVLEQLAPLELAESWDNVGLLLGDRQAEVTRALTCLTLTPDVAEEAIQNGATLIVTHHPILFKPVQRLTAETTEGRMLGRLLLHGIAVYSPHTAWDNAPHGINQQLAERLGLHDIVPLRPRTLAEVKLVTFVPAESVRSVQQALWEAGAGVIGGYRCCSFITPGTGSFHGDVLTNPAVGQAGRLEEVAELRLEVVCPAAELNAALTALRQAHPYETPAIDVIPLQSLTQRGGAGRGGSLPEPLSLDELANRICERLGLGWVELVGSSSMPITKLGIACGSAAEFWKDARRSGCDALLTGEGRFHSALEVRAAGFSMLLAGHYATERSGIEALASEIATACPGLHINPSQAEHSPLRWHCPREERLSSPRFPTGE